MDKAKIAALAKECQRKIMAEMQTDRHSRMEPFLNPDGSVPESGMIAFTIHEASEFTTRFVSELLGQLGV